MNSIMKSEYNDIRITFLLNTEMNSKFKEKLRKEGYVGYTEFLRQKIRDFVNDGVKE